MSAAPIWRPALAGAAATCAGIGLARFAFVPLFPALVQAGWVDGAEAGLLGAAALAGYLAGALAAPALGRRFGTRRTLVAGMALVALSFALCAVPGGLWWLLPWRLLAGVAGALLMALAGPSAQQAVPPERRGAASGVVIAGVGGGVALGAALVPALLAAGLGPGLAWAGLAVAALLLLAFAAPRFAAASLPAAGASASPVAAGRARLLVAYALSGAGMVPPMVYLSDLAARGLGLGVTAGSLVWMVFGAGAVAGTLLGGRAAERFGGAAAVRIWLACQCGALALCLAGAAPALVAAAALGGFSGVGVSAVTLAWARESGGGGGALWAQATAAYAAAQAAAAIALAALFGASGESHAAVFAAGLALSAAALAVARK